MSSGETTLPLDLDILAPLRMTIPWVNMRVAGSSLLTRPRSRITLVQKRE